jgi:transglutaminase-like putative cysteine protease
MQADKFRPIKRVVGSPITLEVCCLSLLGLGLRFAVQGLNEMVRGLDLSVLDGFLWVGLLLGWSLAASRQPGGWVALWMTGLGWIGAFLVSARISGPFLELLSAGSVWLSDLLWRLLHKYPLVNVQTWNAVAAAWAGLAVRLEALWVRTCEWLAALSVGQPVFDPLVTGFFWMVLIWLLSVWASWFTRRRWQPLLALAPVTLALVVGLYTTRADPAWLLKLCVAGLVLKTLSANIRRWQAWRLARIPVADIYFEWAGISLAVIAALTIGAVLTPSISAHQISRAVDRLIHPPDAEEGPDYAASFGLQVRPEPVVVFENAQIASLPAQHLIGAGSNLSQQVVMWVSIRGYTPVSPQALAANPQLHPPRYYGRSLTYDRYTGRGWMSSPVYYTSYKANELAQSPDPASTVLHTVEQQVRFAGEPDGLVYAAGDLVSLDHRFMMAWRGDADALGAHMVSSAYWATSRQPHADETRLRAAGQQYPAWVVERYLTLPESLPTRVRSLALELTAGQSTPYDRVRAIEQYLRQIPYTLELPRPPYGVDIVDYFLFDLKRGYCDYLASAMVVLSRSAGIPARLATGYVSDDYDPTQARFTLTKADAHSWPEVYFPGIGWVGFEPSGRLALPGESQTALGAVESPQENTPETAPVSKLEPTSPKTWFSLFGLGGILVSGLVILMIYFYLRIETLWLVRLTSPAALERIYQGLRRSTRRFGLVVPTGVTPLEFAQAFRMWGMALCPAGKPPGKIAKVFTRASTELCALVELYVKVVYSPAAPTKIEQRQAIHTWQGLRWRFWVIAAGLWSKRIPRKKRPRRTGP